MAHDVFISYASQDKTVADAVCATLESNGIRCWIAPRDVLPGMNWAASIIDAIHSSRVVVLVFSENSNRSSQVAREIERAANRELPIIPFRIQNVLPSDAMEYFLGTPHWLDAMSPPLERHLQQLVTTVQALLNRGEPIPEPKPVPGPVPQPTPRGKGFAFAELWTRINTGPYRWLFAGGAACFAALAVVVIILLIHPPGPKPLTPQQIYTGLLNEPVAAGQLPAGITLDEIYSLDIEADNAKHHAIGEVDVDLKSSNVPALPNNLNNAYVIYIVFPTEGDAAARLSEYSLSFPVSGIKQPSKCFNGTDTVSNTQLGFTACVVQSGPILAYAASRIAGAQQQQGNPNDAQAIAHFALVHLAAVEATSPSAISAVVAANASASASATAAPPTVAPTAVVTPLARLPQNITLNYEDLQSRSQATAADRDVRTVMAHLQADYGVQPSWTLAIHFFSDPSTARKGMSDLGIDDATIQGMVSGTGYVDVVTDTDTNSVVAAIYLPNTDDLQSTLAFCLSSYALRMHNAFVKDDVYPYWFMRGFESYNESRFTDKGFNAISTAAQDVRSGSAPALSAISANSDAQSFINGQNNGSNRLDARGEAAVAYLASKYGNAAIARLLRDGPFNSIGAFNTDLQNLTKQTLAQFNAALNDWLQAS